MTTFFPITRTIRIILLRVVGSARNSNDEGHDGKRKQQGETHDHE